jgi:hypothetical protein
LTVQSETGPFLAVASLVTPADPDSRRPTGIDGIATGLVGGLWLQLVSSSKALGAYRGCHCRATPRLVDTARLLR